MPELSREVSPVGFGNGPAQKDLVWRLKMSKRARLFTVMIVLVLLTGAIWHRTAHFREVQSHLRKLEHLEHRQFGTYNWKDALDPGQWSVLLSGTRPNPQREIRAERDALIALGFLTRHSFNIPPMTNQNDFASFDQFVRRVPFSDSHWSFQFSTNGLDAEICPVDLPVWEEAIRNWNSQRANRNNH